MGEVNSINLMKDPTILPFLTILLLIQEIKRLKLDFAYLSEGFAVDDENRRKAQAWDKLSKDNLVKQVLEDHDIDLFDWF